MFSTEERGKATLLLGEPTIAVIAYMQLHTDGVTDMLEWVKSRRPECVDFATEDPLSLFPHSCVRNPEAEDWKDYERITDNELLVELAGRKCYDSFGLKAGKKTNKEYIAHTQAGEIPHASIMYHAKMSFFIGGVSRRVSHELIRHYVGADRTEEGSPSQESTRYVEHAGYYVVHPGVIADGQEEIDRFHADVQTNYGRYLGYIDRMCSLYAAHHNGEQPKGMDRKRIYEKASSKLEHSCETSFIWTTNPVALAKMFKERDNEAADLEYLRFARKWKRICIDYWPNLFPQFAE